MTAHARPRRAGLFRRRQPDLIPMRTVDYGDGPKIVGFWNELPAYPPHGWGDNGWDHPASTSQDDSPDDAGDALGQDIGDAGDGQGDGPPWDPADPAAYLPPGPDEPSGWYGMTVIDNPVTLTRPYPPAPAPAPAPEPEPVSVSYPPLDLHADLGSCVIFRDTVQGHFVRQEHARGRRAHPGETWLQEQARVYGERFTAELDDFDRLVAGVPVPDYRIAEQWDVPAAAAGGMIP